MSKYTEEIYYLSPEDPHESLTSIVRPSAEKCEPPYQLAHSRYWVYFHGTFFQVVHHGFTACGGCHTSLFHLRRLDPVLGPARLPMNRALRPNIQNNTARGVSLLGSPILGGMKGS